MTIQQEAYKLIDALPEDSIRIIVQLMYRMEPRKKDKKESFDISGLINRAEQREYANATAGKKSFKRIGIAEGECLLDPEYDIDEYNDEIAKMFGVV